MLQQLGGRVFFYQPWVAMEHNTMIWVSNIQWYMYTIGSLAFAPSEDEADIHLKNYISIDLFRMWDCYGSSLSHSSPCFFLKSTFLLISLWFYNIALTKNLLYSHVSLILPSKTSCTNWLITKQYYEFTTNTSMLPP